MSLLPDDWASVFVSEAPTIELIARGSALYVGILILMRLMPRRTGGELATMDLVFVVLIANAATGSMGAYTTIADGFVMVITLMVWSYLVNMLSYRVRVIEWLTSSPPLQVVRDGRLLRRNMRREFLTEEELMGHIREQGIGDLQDVKAAYIEGEGNLSVVPVKRRR